MRIPHKLISHKLLTLCALLVACFLSAITSNSLALRSQSRQLDRQTESIKAWPSKTKRWALIVGVDQYRDSQINALKGSVNDAHTLASALVRYAGFTEDQVIVLTTDQPEERQPTRINILTYLSNLASLVPKDGLLLVSFAGHGIERGGQAYLIPSDARLSHDVSLLEESAVSVTRMHDRIKAIGVGQVVILLDACRNDPGGRADAPNNMTSAYTKFNFDVRNREVQAFATFYATAIGQRAYEYTEKRQGYFTWAIVEGLKGGAANDKGEVTLATLVKYVQDNVPRRIAVDLGPTEQQRPFATIEGYRADELVISISPSNGTTANKAVDPGSSADFIYDAVSDFSTTTNPRGAWTYGYISPGDAPDPSTFTKFAWGGQIFNYFSNEELKGLFGWKVPLPPGTPSGQDTPLGVYKNTSSGKVSVYEPGELSLHPGFGGFYSAVRWISPRTATYSIIGEFTGLDPKPTSTDAHVARDNKPLWSDFINDARRPHQFGLTQSVPKGEAIYFFVGYGSDKEIWNDTTGLSVRILLQDSAAESSAQNTHKEVIALMKSGATGSAAQQDSKSTAAESTEKKPAMKVGVYRFEIEQCKLIGDELTCSVNVTNDSESDRDFYFYPTNSPVASSRAIDSSGREYALSSLSVGNNRNIGGARVELPPGTSLTFVFAFDATHADITRLSLFRLAFSDRSEDKSYVNGTPRYADFRNVPISK